MIPVSSRMGPHGLFLLLLVRETLPSFTSVPCVSSASLSSLKSLSTRVENLVLGARSREN